MDASVFLHAYLRPSRKKTIPEDVEALKRKAQSIVRKINDGKEQVVTSLVHISEIANILEAKATVGETCNIISGLLALDNLSVIEPSKRDYESAIEESRSQDIGINDALALTLMRREGISEIYSFDSDFDAIEGMKRRH